MKIRVPEPIETKDPLTGASGGAVSFQEFVLKAVLLSDPKWSYGYPAVRSAMAIERAMGNIQDGCFLLSEEDWKGLVGAVNAPRRMDRAGRSEDGFGCWLPMVIRQFEPFMEAIVKAELA